MVLNRIAKRTEHRGGGFAGELVANGNETKNMRLCGTAPFTQVCLQTHSCLKSDFDYKPTSIKTQLSARAPTRSRR